MKFIFSVLILFFSQFCFSASASGDWKFGIGLGYSPNYLVPLSGSGISSGLPYSISYNLEYTAATSLALDFRKLNRNSWGLVTGFEYETERELSKLVANGINFPVSGPLSKYQTHFLHFAAAYRWDIFYIPFGLTYGFTKFTPAAGTTATASITNGGGAYFGFGWYINDAFAIEYVSRSAATTLSVVSGANSESTTGTIGSALLGVKAFF